MKIDAVSVKFPSKIIMVEETLEMIRFYSKDSFQGDIERALQVIKKILLYSGASERRWLEKGEKPIGLIKEAVLEVLKNGNCSIEDVDLLIYTGIGRGFTEPGGSYLLAKSLGMKDVQCFDLLDACMSWTRALNIADMYLKTKQYKKILIVNGEFNNINGDAFFPGNYCISDLKQINWTFPSYTIGDAASATLLSFDDSSIWDWNFLSKPEFADLCTIPTIGFSLFSECYEKIGKNGPGRFCSFGNEMHKKATPIGVKFFKKVISSKKNIKMIFPHASSKQAWENAASICGVEDKMYYIYPKYGNLVSASVPAGIALAFNEQKIKRGDSIVIWTISAGMSFAVAEFKF